MDINNPKYKKYNADIKENPSFFSIFWRRKDFLYIFELCNLNFDYEKGLPMNEQKQIKNLDYKKTKLKAPIPQASCSCRQSAHHRILQAFQPFYLWFPALQE